MAWLNDDFMDDFNEEAILDESMFDEEDTSLEEGGWEDDEDDGADKWSDDDDDTLSEADFIDTDYYDDQVEPTTVPSHDAEKDQYAKVDNPEVMKDENGTEEVEMESFTDWDDLF